MHVGLQAHFSVKMGVRPVVSCAVNTKPCLAQWLHLLTHSVLRESFRLLFSFSQRNQNKNVLVTFSIPPVIPFGVVS